MCRHLFLVMIEAQNKSCNLGYIQQSLLYLSTCTALTPNPVLKVGGGGDELESRKLESELYVFSQATKNLLNSSKTKWKVINDVCYSKYLGSSLYRQDS